MARNTNYSKDRNTLENFNDNDKYSETGESEYTRESTIPYDQDEVLSERHYNLGAVEDLGKKFIKRREDRSALDLPRPNYRGRGPKGYRRSDEMIKDDVSEALYRSTEVDASYIEVSVSNGHVTLKGSVQDRLQKKLAERAIENLAGVDDVFNELKISQHQNTKLGKHGLIDNITGMN
jgi:hypothetical protein